MHKKTGSPWQIDKKADGYKMDSGKVTWHPHGFK